jgi:hypothetical protein
LGKTFRNPETSDTSANNNGLHTPLLVVLFKAGG